MKFIVFTVSRFRNMALASFSSFICLYPRKPILIILFVRRITLPLERSQQRRSPWHLRLVESDDVENAGNDAGFVGRC